MKNQLSKYIFCTCISFVFTIHVYGQNDYDLNQIHEAAKTMFVKPETLDRLMIRLRVLEKDINASEEAMLMDTYRIISDQYIANNHFSQAYQVYEKYINFKGEFSARLFMSAIDSTKNSIELRRLNDGTELMNLQNQVQQLQIDNDLLVSKRINFKKYFSFIIIALSTIFALMLVRSAMKLLRIRTQLKENKQVMKTNHRVATVGSFAKGLVNQTRQKAGQMEDLAASIGKELEHLSSIDKKNLTLTSEIRTQCKEIIKGLNASGIEA